MNNVITKLIVSEYLPFAGVELDLQDDALGIEIKQTNKDMQDISKVFLTISKTITLPPTPKNQTALKNFDNSKIVGGTGKLFAKITTNGVCSMSGELVVKKVNIDENGNLENYETEFQTISPSLSERIGDDLLWNVGRDLLTDTYTQGVPSSSIVGNKNIITQVDTIVKTSYVFEVGFNANIFGTATNAVQVGQIKKTVSTTQKTLTQTNTYAVTAGVGNYISTYSVAYGNPVEVVTIESIVPKWYTPLASKTREWVFGGANDLENVAIDAGAIKFNELFPAVNFSTILYLLFKKYDLSIDFPLANSMAITELFMLANNGGSSFADSNTGYFLAPNLTPTPRLIKTKLHRWDYDDMPTEPIFYNEIHDGKLVTVVEFVSDGSFQDNYGFQLSLMLKDFVSDADNNIKIKMVSLGSEDSFLIEASGSDLLGQPTDLVNWDGAVGGGTTPTTALYKQYFFTSLGNIAMAGKYYFSFTSTKPVSMSSFVFSFDQYARTTSYGKRRYDFWRLDLEGNFDNQTSENKIDLIRNLPNMKVKDFLTSLISTFNISIYDTDPNTNVLTFLNVIDINGNNKSYKKNTVDYTPFFNKQKKVVREKSSDYTAYKFTHANSKLKENVAFLAQPLSEGVAYGAVQYPLVQSSKDVIYTIETKFVVVPFSKVIGADIEFYKWFENSEPTMTETAADLYKTVYDEPVILYPKKSQSIPPIYYTARDGSNQVLNSYLSSGVSYELGKTGTYLPPFGGAPTSQKFSNGGSVLFSPNENVFTGETNLNSLYQLYYSNFITKALDPKTLNVTMFFHLPAIELIISKDANGNENGFRMQNEIVVGEEKYSILESNINYITGDCKLITQNLR